MACAAVAALSVHEAQAQGNLLEGYQYYGVLFGGLNWLEDAALSVNGTGNDLTTGTSLLDFDLGYAFGGALGVMLHSNLRGEFELSYRRNGVSSFFEGSDNSFVAVGGGDHVDAFALMANLWYDHPLHDGWDLHFGGGIGAARIGYDITNLDSNDPNAPLNDAAWAFAGQIGVGVGKQLGNGQVLSLDYRLFIAGGVDLTGVDNDGDLVPVSTDEYTAHSLLLTWRVPLNGL